MSANRGITSRLARAPRAFARRAGTTPPRERILIVCEGEKTEPNYLEGVVRACRLTATDVIICGRECDSAPISVVNFAEKIFKESSSKFLRFGKVYCVFDRDTHTTFDAAMCVIAKRANDGFHAIVSYPCFEYWFLLHFQYSRKNYAKAGAKSPGDLATADLNQAFLKHFGFPYAKAIKGTYKLLESRLETAAKHAMLAENDALETGNLNPSTAIVHLINFLRSQGIPHQPPLR